MADTLVDLGLDPGFIDGETTQVTFTIEESGTGLVPDNLWVTIFDEATGAYVNNRNRFELTPVSNYVDGQGVLTFNLAIADCALLNDKLTLLPEYRRIIFEWDWLTATRVGYFLGRWRIRPRRKEADES